MITEDFCSYEVAKLLKKKGFNESVHYEYHYTISIPQFHKKSHNFNGSEYANCQSEWYSAPTHQMAKKWLREVHNLFIDAYYDCDFHEGYMFSVHKLPKGTTLEVHNKNYSTYEEACEAAIKYCLEKLI